MIKDQHKTEFLKLYEPVHGPFSRFCRALSGNAMDAEDLLQDTVLNMLENFGKIKDKSAFKAYMFSVASNLYKMKMRRSKFRAEFNDKEIGRIIDREHNQEYLADFRIVYEKMLSLPQRTAEALILFHVSDLSLEDIQKIQGGSLSGVKLRLKRGREKLLSLLNTKQQLKIAQVFLMI
ncbi:MAG: RNA polymerase sigma factor [Bacteroidales bacterium]|nr:RNA polymerase sigma factor [Bacteroidales bacterium]